MGNLRENGEKAGMPGGNLTSGLTCCLKSVGRINALSLVQMSVVRAPKAEAINPPCPRKLPLTKQTQKQGTKLIYFLG